MGHEGGARRRWATLYATLLSTFACVGVFGFYALVGHLGRGWQVGFLVEGCFAIIGILASCMAAESLAWRLSQSQRRALLLATVLVVGLPVVALALLGAGLSICDSSGAAALQFCVGM